MFILVLNSNIVLFLIFSKPSTLNKKIKDLKVLDAKSGQNISILLGGSLKHLTYMDVRKCILRCDDKILTDNILKQLIDYLPPTDQLNKLRQYKDQYEELTEAEQFAVTVSYMITFLLFNTV